MPFRSWKREPAGKNSRVADIGDAGTDQTTLRETQPLAEWRRSAQRITHAWNAWLAADTRDRAARYRAFVAALASEEHAGAKLARVVRHQGGPPRQCDRRGDALDHVPRLATVNGAEQQHALVASKAHRDHLVMALADRFVVPSSGTATEPIDVHTSHHPTERSGICAAGSHTPARLS